MKKSQIYQKYEKKYIKIKLFWVCGWLVNDSVLLLLVLSIAQKIIQSIKNDNCCENVYN